MDQLAPLIDTQRPSDQGAQENFWSVFYQVEGIKPRRLSELVLEPVEDSTRRRVTSDIEYKTL